MLKAKVVGSSVPGLAGSVAIFGKGLASLSLAVCLKQKGIPNNIYIDDKSVRRPSAPFILLDHKVCQPLCKALGLDDEQFRRRIETPGSLVNSESQPWAQLGSIRAERSNIEKVLLESANVVDKHSLSAAEATPDGTLVTFKNGSKLSSAFAVFGYVVSRVLAPDTEGKRLPLVAFSGRAQCSEADFETTFGSSLPEPTRCFVKMDREHGHLLQVWVRRHEPGTPVELAWLFSRPRQNARTEMLRSRTGSAQSDPDVNLIIAQELKAISTNVPPAIADILRFSKAGRYGFPKVSPLVSRRELDRLSMSGAVLCGGAAYATRMPGLCFAADESTAVIEDALSLADCITTYGVSQNAINHFYRLNYEKWRQEAKNNYDSIMRLHGSDDVRSRIAPSNERVGPPSTRRNEFVDEVPGNLKKSFISQRPSIKKVEHDYPRRETPGSNFEASTASGTAQAVAPTTLQRPTGKT